MDLTHPGWPHPTETPRLGMTVGVLLAATCEALATAIVGVSFAFRASEAGATVATMGMLFISLSVSVLVAAPILGFLSDRAGRKPALIAGGVCSVLGFACFAWGPSEAFLFAGMILRGFGSGRLGVEQAALGDGAGNRTHLRLLGALALTGNVAWFLAPLVSSWFTLANGALAPMWAAVSLAVLSLAIVAAVVPGGRLTSSPRAIDDPLAMPAPGYRTSARAPEQAAANGFSFAIRPGPALLLVAGLVGAIAASLVSTSTSFDLYRHRDAQGEWMNALALMALGPLVAHVAAIAGVGGALGARRAGLFSLAVVAGGVAIALVGDSFFATMIGAGLSQAGNALWLLCLASLLAERAPREAGAALGTSQALFAGAAAAGSSAAGALISTHEKAPALVAAALTGLAAALVFLVARVESPAPEPTSSSPASPAS